MLTYIQIDKVDNDYYLHSDRLDVSEETKIRATKEEADEYFAGAMKTDAKPNFISDVFFILNSIFHLGMIKTIDTRSKAEKNISQMEDELKSVEGRRGEWGSVSWTFTANQCLIVQNPTTQAQGEAAIKKLKVSLAVLCW